MATFIHSSLCTRWPAHTNELRKLLGLADKAKLPAAGLAPVVVQGIKVWIEPAPAPVMRTIQWSGKQVVAKSSTHRVMAECPHCGKHMSAGRLQQHKCDDLLVRMRALFTRLNDDCAETGESVVPFTDVEYYTDQIINAYVLPRTRAAKYAAQLAGA